MYNLKYGDECTMEYRVSKFKSTEEDWSEATETDSIVSMPVVKNIWFGSQKLAKPKDPEFVAWLSKKAITLKYFLSWVQNRAPEKPYFPFLSDIYSSKVVGYVRAEEGFAAQGVYLEIGDVISRIDEEKTSDEKEPTEDANTDDAKSRDNAKSETASPKIAILLRDDFFVCGVNAHHADLRVLLHLNDEVSCQVRPICNSDKRRIKKELLRTADSTVTHVAYLGYVGPTRPTQASLSPTIARDLDTFLKSKLGLTVDEFQAIRFPKTWQATPEPVPVQPPPNTAQMGPFAGFGRPPSGNFPGVFGPFFPEVPIGRLNIATNIAARAVNLGSATDPRVFGLLNTPGEVEVASQVIRILSHSLILLMQNKLKMMQMNVQPANLPDVTDLKAQVLQVRTAEQVLLNTADQPPRPEPSLPPLPPLPPNSAKSFQNKLKEVEEKLQKETEAAAAKIEAAKAKPIVRDPKKILESYKAAKARDEESNPLDLLREFSISKKKITADKTTIWFDNSGFPKSAKVNYMTTVGLGGYYTLDTMYHLVQVTKSCTVFKSNQLFKYNQLFKNNQLFNIIFNLINFLNLKTSQSNI